MPGLGLGLGMSFAAAPPVFTPADRGAALITWYRPDADQVTTVSGAVSQILDKSGLGRKAAQGTAANRPTYVASDAAYNGKPTMSWPGGPGNIALVSDAWSAAKSAPVTIYVVGQSDDTGAPVFTSEQSTVYPYTHLGAGQVNLIGDGAHSILGTTIYPAKPCVYAFVLNGASSKVYFNSNGHLELVAGDAGGTNIQQLCIGNGPFGGNSLVNGKLAEMVVVNGADTPAQVKDMFEYLCRYSAYDTAIMFTGNSLVYGTASSDAAHDFVHVIGNSLPSNYAWFQDGNPGVQTSSLKTCTTSLPNQVIARRQLAFIWEITNDIAIGGVDATTAYNNVVAWSTKLRQHGYRVAVVTCIARADAPWTPAMETIRLAVNANIVANYASWADALIDLAADVRFQNPNDTTYFWTDKVHLNDTGHALVAAIAKPILLGMAA